MYLASFRVGNCPCQLVRLARGDRRAAVIANAMDAAPPEIRSESVKRELDALTALGLVAEELDLRDYFGTGGPVATELRRYDIGWLRGGNVFVLRYALGADAELTRLLGEDAPSSTAVTALAPAYWHRRCAAWRPWTAPPSCSSCTGTSPSGRAWACSTIRSFRT